MKISGKLITGIVIVGILYVYLKKVPIKTLVSKRDMSTQTDFMETIIEELTLEKQDQEVSNEINKEEYKDIAPKHNYQIIDYSYYSEEELKDQEDIVVEEQEDCIVEESTLNYSVIELKEMAKEQKIKGFSRMKKAELIEKLEL